MNPYMAYDAVNTKVVTKLGKLMDKEVWNKILSFETVEQLTDYLKELPEISRLLRDFSAEDIHRDSLESLLGKFKTKEIEDILNYFSGPYKDFIKAMLIESEINDLSLILRKISRKQSLEDIKIRFIHSEKYSKIPYDLLISSRSVEEFTQNLKDTPYYIGLRNLSDEDALSREFHIEMKLQGVLYKTLLDKAERLSREDAEVARDIIGHKIDFENIQWIYRAIRYYSISPEEMLVYSLDGGKKITYKRLKALSYVNSVDEFKELVKGYLKYDVFEGITDSSTDIGIDYNVLNYLKSKKYHNIGSFISYIFILGIITDDMTSITEGIKYHVPREKLVEYLAYKI